MRSRGPDQLTGARVVCAAAGGAHDGVARHGDHAVVLGGDIHTEPLTLPVVQPTGQGEEDKY